MVSGIENIASAALIALAMGPAAFAGFYQMLHELLKSGLSVLNALSKDINHLLRVLKRTNHKAYLLLLKAYIHVQNSKSRQIKKPVTTPKRKIIKYAVKKLAKSGKSLVGKIKAKAKKASAPYKAAKVAVKKSFVKSAALSKTKMPKPSNAYALKAAFKEIGKKEYMSAKSKSAAKHIKV